MGDQPTIESEELQTLKKIHEEIKGLRKDIQESVNYELRRMATRLEQMDK